MVINPAVVPLPVSTAHPPTESVRNEARLQERVPETKGLTENVKLKPTADEGQQAARTETTRTETLPERQVQERGEGNQQQGSQQQGDGRDEGRDGRESQGEKREQQAQERQEQQEVQQLKSTVREVRAHEAAHAAVGGQYAGAPTYTFKRGPDGQRYAVAGEVPIDTSVVPGDPQATIEKMQQVQRAALAPADPSSQDLRVAAQAAAKANEARSELLQEQSESRSDETRSDQSRLEPSQSSQVRFQQKLRNLGVIDAPEVGERLSVTA